MPPKYCDLHVTRPISRWDEGLPLGNGKMGALLWGGPERLTLSLDRTDLWDTTPCPGVSGEDYTYEIMVSMARAGDEDGVRRVFDTPYQQATPCKLPAGRLVLHLPMEESWESRLSLGEAAAWVHGSNLNLECFLSARRDVGVLRLNISLEDLEFRIENPDFGLAGEEDKKAPPGSLKQLHYPPVETGEAELRKRAKSLIQLGIPEWQAWAVSNCRKAYWHMAKNGHVQRAISTEKLAQRGYKSILELYERALMRLNRRIPNGTYGGVRGRLGI